MKLSHALFLTLSSKSWCIEPEFAYQYLSNILMFVSNVDADFADEPVENVPYSFFAGYKNSSKTTEGYYDSAEKGSTAIVPLRGVMTKHTQMCGPVGCETIAARILEADAHKNIKQGILLVESGGGQSETVDILDNAFLATNKPWAVYIDGTCCSAALFASKYADLVMANSDFAMVGSLGVLGSLTNDEQQLKNEGIERFINEILNL